MNSSFEHSSYEHNKNSDNYSCSSSEASSSSNRHEEIRTIILAPARPKRRAGRRIFKETRHPMYHGVRRRNNKWICESRVPSQKSAKIWLGTYATPEMAARAHDVAALTLRGKSACLNFADSAWRLPPLLPASNCAKEIQRVAREAAEAFAVEDSCEQITDGEVCSSDVIVSVVEDGDNNEKALQLKGLCLDIEVPFVASFEEQEMHDWVRSMADEPLRSPPHSFEGYGWEWSSDMEADANIAEVFLWSFPI